LITIEGGCHCGHVRFEVRLETPEVELLDCGCSICQITGYLHLIVPDARFRQTEGRSDLILYRFGSGRARHLFCQHCGIKSFYRPRSHPDAISVNWRCLDEDHGLTAKIVPFDGVYPV